MTGPQVEPGSPIELRLHAGLEAPERGAALRTVSVGPTGEAVALWDSPGASRARVMSYAPRPVHDIAIADPVVKASYAQPIPGGGALLVAARCWWKPETGAERNAAVYDAEGELVQHGTLGDGIGQLRTTTSGRIWVGYFDEGVFGNLGWGFGANDPGHPEAIGSAGLIRFDGCFDPEWRFRVPPERDDLDPIADCYALNVIGETAWATYHTGFPVVRITGEETRFWTGAASDANALLVDGTRCALIGCYERNRILFGDLEQGVFEQRRLMLPGGRPLPNRFETVGHGPNLHVFIENLWYRLDLEDIR